jgi:nucleoid DNA-binding protein
MRIFVSFIIRVRHRAARTGRPQTGEEIQIA